VAKPVTENISRKKHQHRDLSTTLRSGRDDKRGGQRFQERVALTLVISTGGWRFHERVALTLVISTEAQRSGETSVLMLFPGNVFLES
jgi:hypothetical protein